ncbi:hypothetical protein [Paenibacillus sp. Leaf72]|uniref:hypothetical protein n=1 Tax=Paenibacillus sp. Leaf72 TaxID=1736234 RepID=UPI0006FB8AAF|nr:hypothetical protein [Paenibacillus sp. Leaf72]KQN96829.1 hypothetical protein ASF12_22415 [Paenibacillus sp. Leaf72]
MYKIAQKGSIPYPIKSLDLLTAVRHCINVEGELYRGNELIIDFMALSYEENISNLLAAGITARDDGGYLLLSYTDPSLNTSNVFVWDYTYPWEGKMAVQIFIQDYEDSNAIVKFASLEEALQAMRDKYLGQFSENEISVYQFTDTGCEKLTLTQKS